MPNIISRAPKTPRKIRDIRPKRQLLRNDHKKRVHEEDEWYKASSDGGGEQAQLRGVAAVNRFRRPLAGNSDHNLQDDRDTRHNRLIALLKLTFSVLKQLYEKIKQAPRREKRKRILWVIILISVWRSIYLVDLERYSRVNVGNNFNGNRNLPHVAMPSIDDEFSSLEGFPDDASMFGKSQSKLDSSPIASDRGPGISGLLAENILHKDTAGMASMKILQSDSKISSSQQHPRYMADSVRLGGDEYAASRENMYSINKIEAETFDGLQTQRSWTNPQSKGQNQQPLFSPYQEPPKDLRQMPGDLYERSLHDQHSLDSTRLMSRGGHSSKSIQVSGLRSLSGSNYGSNVRGSNFNMDQDTIHEGNIGPPDEIGSNQRLKQSQLVEPHTIPKAVHTSAPGLDCAEEGGPFSEPEHAEIVYWRDIPADASFTSPYYNPQAQEPTSTSFWKAKYLTFEMDDAGWNNMRLGLENMMLLAHSMGRTLVMPPKRQMAHGLFDRSGSKVVSFSDFYEIDAINAKQKGLNIITMDEFLQREALNGELTSKLDGAVIYPPNNQVHWDNQRLDPLWKYIRNVTKSFSWNPKQCVLAFPAAGADDQHLFNMMADVLVGKDGRPFPHYSEFQGRPVNVDAPPIERFREILAGRRKICMYDRKMHKDNHVVHFKADQGDGTRLITQFYAFLWFEDWRQDLWAKRFVRDNLRYNNEIMCLSARIISALRDRAKRRVPENVNGVYNAVHVRRGDFQQQFPMTKMDASEILAGLQESIAPGSTLFICTNERDLSFFEPIQKVYDVSFLGDFGKMLSDINPNYFPLVEQIVASRGRVFIGTFFSTFSAYIARLRGYYSVKEMHEGHMHGGLHHTYFLPSKWKKEMHLYQAVHTPIYGRDFPAAWRDIDRLDLPDM